MTYRRKLIKDMLSGIFDGCILLNETFDVDSDEGASTAIFLDGKYQNRAIAASANLDIVDRYKLKDMSKDGQLSVNKDDLEFDINKDKLVIERVHGNVQILLCSEPVLKLIHTIVEYNS